MMRETDTLGGPLLPASLTNKVALAKARPLTPDNNDAGEGPDRDKGSDGATPRASLVRGDFPKRKSLSCLRTSMLPSLTGESFPRDSSASTVGQLPPLIDPSVPPRTSQPVVNSNPPSQPVANRDTSSHDTIVRPIPAYDDESGFSTPGSMEDGDGERRDRSHSFSHFDGEDQGDDTAGGRSTRSFSAAARVVVVANKMKKYRRSSAALHTDLLRAFVPDILINIINSYYSNLVNIVYSFGGDIIKIAGDALYCVFTPDAMDLRGAVLCAALCSMMLRDVAADGLTLHVGISCGNLCFGILGGIEDYWECLMSGEPIGLVAQALDEAQKQQVVVSNECLQIAGDCCRGVRLPSNNLLLQSVQPPRQEKRGSVRVATMIAMKGLPIELERVEGLELLGGMGAASNGTPSDARSVRDRPMGVAAAAAAAAEAYGGGSDNTAATKMGGAADGAGVRPGETNAGKKGLPFGKKNCVPNEVSLGAAGKMRAEASARVLPVMQGFVPGPVSEMLAAGIFMYMAEMRTVTTLFVKLDSYCPEKHKNLLSLQIHLTTVQKILAEHEGFLRQFLVDDKALCGRVGGKIRSEYAMVGDVINLAARLMGKAKGRIVCDEVTHDLVCTMVSTETLFKRLDPMVLKGKAHPIAPFVCLAQQGSDMWETHKQTRMVGRAQLQNSVNTFLDALGKDIEGPPVPHVVVIEGVHGTGKTMVADRVKKSASQFFRKKVYMYSMAQQSSNVPYSGAKGMFRTIFGLDYLGDDAFAIKDTLLQKVRGVYGSAEDDTTGVAIAALEVVLGVNVGGETEEEIMDNRPRMKGRLPMHAIHSVLICGFHEAHFVIQGNLQVISDMATEVLGSEPTVFVLDNVHLMDEMSWKLIIQLLTCPVRLLMVLTATPVEEDIRKRKQLTKAKKENHGTEASTGPLRAEGADGLNLVWHGEHGETHLHMQQYIRAKQLSITTKFSLLPFSKEELRLLLQHSLVQDKTTITEDLVKTVYGLSGGNPYWCIEVVRFIQEHGVEVFMARIATGKVGEDNKRSADGGAAPVSPEEAMMGRMGILVVCRFERLMVEEQNTDLQDVYYIDRQVPQDGACKSVLRNASVAGVEFSVSLLNFVLPRNIRPQLELIIQALVTARFIVKSRHSYYKFRNSMVHMVLYNLTPATGRKRMHKVVADYYIAQHREDPRYLPVTTYHLLKAEVNSPLAVEWLCKTAAHALVSFCYEDCVEALEKAVELVGSVSEIHEVMAVHHHISAMHELGYTARKASDGSLPSNSSASEGRNQEGSASSNGTFQGENEVETIYEQTRTNRPQLVGLDERISTQATDVVAPPSLSARITKLEEQTREMHGKLCPLGEMCRTLQGNYNTTPGRQSIGGKVDGAQSVDSRHNGSFLEPTEGCRTPTRCPNSPARLQRRSSTQDSVTGGDGMQLPAQDSEGGSPARSSFNSRDSSRSPLRGSNSPLSPLSRRGPRSSLKWGVTQLLDNKLSHYLLPGAESPALPNSCEVNFSTANHHLPPASGGDDGRFDREETEDESTLVRCSLDATNNVNGGAQSKTQAIRTKVSETAQLISMKSSRGMSKAKSFKSSPSIANIKNGDSEVDCNHGVLERAKQMVAQLGIGPQALPSHSISSRRIGGVLRLAPLESKSHRSASDCNPKEGLLQERPVNNNMVTRPRPQGEEAGRNRPSSSVCVVF